MKDLTEMTFWELQKLARQVSTETFSRIWPFLVIAFIVPAAIVLIVEVRK